MKSCFKTVNHPELASFNEVELEKEWIKSEMS